MLKLRQLKVRALFLLVLAIVPLSLFQNCSAVKAARSEASSTSQSNSAATPNPQPAPSPSPSPSPGPAPAPTSGFNNLPQVPGVKVEVRWNTAVVSFNGIAAARDYRIYVLPASANISFDSNGIMTVPSAVYRCSGLYGASPVLNLQWPGLIGPTQLVIEALDSVCPDKGVLSANALPTDTSGMNWKTQTQLTSGLPSGEIFINGQALNANKPKAIARSFISASPQTPGVWDWSMDFSANSPAQTFSPLSCNISIGTMCFQTFLLQSNLLQIEFNNIETAYHSVGTVLGELRANFVDWANDTNGKFRVTPKASGTMSADKFLHATMATQAVTTARRYPQIIISDRLFPVSDYMINGNSLVIQTRGNDPFPVEVQVCDHKRWDVNTQCPGFSLGAHWQPGFNGYLEDPLPAGTPKLKDLMGWDRKVQFDVYASTKKVYVFLEGKPFGCVNLPASGAPSGVASVTFANTLYHSGADDSVPAGNYGSNQMHFQTLASFNNLGFSSGVSAPAWDETSIPCKPATAIADNP